MSDVLNQPFLNLIHFRCFACKYPSARLSPFKKISVLISLLYLLTGVYLAVNSGISHDEFHEQQNWNVNLEAIKSFFISGEYNDLLNYKDKYHGIGFHFFFGVGSA